ncbi:MAG: two-component sensor histidine kinase, partial [Flavobacteriaceae bacterium]|nr:two-component sensor histidine kinase [Flavobacteriaceae bacterium]
MKLKKLSLRNRIFLAMILLVVIASVLIALVTIYQYNEQANEYHKLRLERKENTIRTSIDIELYRRPTWPLEEKNLRLIFKDNIYDLSDINQLDIDIYNLSGKLQISSSSAFPVDSLTAKIPQDILDELAENVDHRVVKAQKSPGGIENQSSYTYIYDRKLKPIGILHLPYLEDNSDQINDLKEFLGRLAFVYLFMLIIAVIIAYYVSSYITKSLQKVSEMMHKTALDKRNEKIYAGDTSIEIYNLVNAYNEMVDQLDVSAAKLARSERENAWREMAKQVAHEIKNPLTPMRLTVQSFEQRFDPEDPDIKSKVNEFSKSLIQQIDTMSSIASAFSSFAEMPRQKKEELNVVEVVKLALDIFNKPYVRFETDKD